MSKATLREKIGYGFGDMASSMFWKIFSAYLPFFYTNVFGLPLEMAAVLFLVTKIWDAVSDPVMGMLADRTHSRWGKYRPWLLCPLWRSSADDSRLRHNGQDHLGFRHVHPYDDHLHWHQRALREPAGRDD